MINSFKIKMAIKIAATTILNLPNKRRSGASKNSMMFIVATKAIWVAVHQRDLMPLTTQTAIKISEQPMALVRKEA